MKNLLTPGWCATSLSQVVKLINGDRGEGYPSKSSFVSTGVPFINAGHLHEGKICTAGMNYISERSFDALRSGKVQLNDSLFCLRGSLGKVGMVRDLSRGGIASSLVIVRPEPQIHPGFINYYLRSPQAKSQIEKHDNGSAQPNLAARSLGNFILPLPPAQEQQRIADKLDIVLARVNAVNDRLARVAPLLKRFRQAVLAAATSGGLTADWREASAGEPLTPVAAIEDAGNWSFDTIPATWQMQPALECFKDCTDSARKVPQAEYAIEGLIPVVDQGAQLVGGYVNDSNMQSASTLPVIVFGDHTRCIKWIDFPFAQGADGVKVLAPQLGCKRYGWVLLKALQLPDKGYSRHFKYLKRSMLPVPPTAEQSEIVRRVDILFAFADRLEARLQAAQTAASRLTPALLAKAFRGELVSQDPADEPAAELLKRLAATQPQPANKRGRARASAAL